MMTVFVIFLLIFFGRMLLPIRRSAPAASALRRVLKPRAAISNPGFSAKPVLLPSLPCPGLSLLIAVMVLSSCRQPAAGELPVGPLPVAGELPVGPLPAAEDFVNRVDVMVLEQAPFHKEILSNGRLRALRRSQLSFPFSKPLKEVHVINGQYVEEGQLLATLCDEELIRRMESASIRKKQARLEMEYLLLGHGLSLADSLEIPQHIREAADIGSGYREARNQLRNLERDLERSGLKAPFGGLISGLDVRPHEWVQAGQALCTLIDPAAFLVEFPIMEREYPGLEAGSPVIVTPFARQERHYPGHVHGMDPRVDENGQIHVTALINGTEGLMEGMKVRVRVLHEIPHQLVVPRSAVIYRDQQEVLFRYERGRAMWTYVQVLYGNSSDYSVVARPGGLARLAPGDTLITAGHLNLAHRSRVKIRKDASLSHK